MSTARFTEEFKLEAVKQITQHQRPVAEVAKRLGVSTHSLYVWVKRYGKPRSNASKTVLRPLSFGAYGQRSSGLQKSETY